MTVPTALLADTTRAAAAVAANMELPVRAPAGLEATMLADDKLFVVLAVVLIIWTGIIVLVTRTDRRLRALERSVDAGVPPASDL